MARHRRQPEYRYALFSNTGGSKNTADGAGALSSNTSGKENTASGFLALYSNTGGIDNVAVGADALVYNLYGNGNTAAGFQALFLNTNGSENTAIGNFALFSNTTASFNTAVGGDALALTEGAANTAVGYGALAGNRDGRFNVASGFETLNNNTSGDNNRGIGYGALSVNTTGENNIGVGAVAGSNITTASNVICIGANVPGANVSNSCFIGSIRGITTQNGDAIPVLIDSDGQLGTMSSSRRYKTDIEPMDKASESILALKPVSFRYTVNKDKPPQFGLIAEEVARVNPNLVARDKNGEIYTVRYDAVNAMLLNEFLKEHHRVEKLEATVASLVATVKEQAAQLQQVSTETRVNKPTTQVAQSNP